MGIIDAELMQGPFMEGKEEKFKLSSERQVETAQSFFEGKMEVPEGEPTFVNILHGAPGSGKTEQGYEFISSRSDFDKTVVVCYDEYGALYAIEEYDESRKAAIAIENKEQRVQAKIDAWANYRDDSQIIRSRVFYGGLNSPYHLYVDSTSSSPVMLKVLEGIRAKKDYICMLGYYAPLGISEERVFSERDRPTSWDEFITKRLGAHDMFPKLVEAVDDYKLFYNPDNETPAVEVMRFGNGIPVPGSLNHEACRAMSANLEKEAKLIEEYLNKRLERGDLQPGQVEGIRARVEDSVKNYHQNLKNFAQMAAPVPKPPTPEP